MNQIPHHIHTHRKYNWYGLRLGILLFVILFLFVDKRGGSRIRDIIGSQNKEEVKEIMIEKHIVDDANILPSTSTGMNDEDIEQVVNALTEDQKTQVVKIVEEGHYDSDVLEQVYQDTQDKQILASLVHEYIDDFQFEKALTLIEQNKDIIPALLSWSDYVYVYANSSNLDVNKPTSINNLQTLIDALQSKKLLAQDEYFFYQGLIHFWYGDLTAFYKTLNQITFGQYKSFVDAITQDKQYVDSQQFAPSYYANALMALTVMQYRYTIIAQKVSLDVLLQNNNYILPYQILAYSNFLSHQRNNASKHVHELLARDPQQRAMYQFLLGVISFWQQKYQESVLYLIGVDEYYLLPDMYRYLVLSYHELGDVPNVIINFEKLLGEKLGPSDYYTFFLMAYYEPIRYGQNYEIISQNPNLPDRYIQHCKKFIDENFKHVCEIGEVGKLLQQKNNDIAHQKLMGLAREHPKSFIFKALGDYYVQTDNHDKAIQYYLKAMRMTTDLQERFHTKSKILQLYQKTSYTSQEGQG